uniref:hypothetical protein n=1 Tax=Rhodococcus qingshengii TaxID=334542 RepID=UPI001C4E26EA|nr:hypothetical protein [Rhodococcus qingshengii]
MSIDHSDRLTAEQRQRIRQVQQYVEDHAAEVDAAARVDDPAVDTLQTSLPATARTGALAAVRAALVEKTAASLSPTVSAIREASAASRLGMQAADMVKPLDLKKLGFVQPPLLPSSVTLPNWAFDLPTLKVDLPNPLLNALKVSSPLSDLSSVLPTVDLTTLILPLPSVVPDLGMTAGFGLDKGVMPGILDQVRGFDPSITMPVLDALKATSKWESVLPRIDLSSFARVQQISEAVTSLVNQVAPVIRIVEDMRSMIGALLDGWQTLAGVGHRIARSGLVAAVKAREAVLSGDHDAVDWFARTWLGIKGITVDVLDAVIGALLDWSVEGDSEAIEEIKALVWKHHANIRPIGETQWRGRRVTSLNRRVIQPGGGEVELGTLVPGPDVDCTGIEFNDPRAVALFAKLDPVEKQIVAARFATTDRGITWADAAEDCGYPAAMGEAVRRKVRGLKRRIAPEAS